MTKPARKDKLAVGLGCIFMLVGSSFAIGSLTRFLGDRAIEADGPRAVALVTSTRVGHDDGPTYEIAYKFRTDAGRLIVARRHVSRRLFAQVKAGDLVTVAYSAAPSSRNFPVGEGETHLPVTLFISVIGVLLASLGAFVTRAGLYGNPDR